MTVPKLFICVQTRANMINQYRTAATPLLNSLKNILDMFNLRGCVFSSRLSVFDIKTKQSEKVEEVKKK